MNSANDLNVSCKLIQLIDYFSFFDIFSFSLRSFYNSKYSLAKENKVPLTVQLKINGQIWVLNVIIDVLEFYNEQRPLRGFAIAIMLSVQVLAERRFLQ